MFVSSHHRPFSVTTTQIRHPERGCSFPSPLRQRPNYMVSGPTLEEEKKTEAVLGDVRISSTCQDLLQSWRQEHLIKATNGLFQSPPACEPISKYGGLVVLFEWSVTHSSCCPLPITTWVQDGPSFMRSASTKWTGKYSLRKCGLSCIMRHLHMQMHPLLSTR